MAQDRTIIQKTAMIEAIGKSLGIVTTACNQVGISRETHYKWIKEDDDYKKAIDDVENIALDFAESQLHKQIKEGNTAATIFYLKTKGRKRGYIERTEIDLNNKRPIQVNNIGKSEIDDGHDHSL